MRVRMGAFDSQEDSRKEIIAKITCQDHEILEEEVKGETMIATKTSYDKKSNYGAGGYETTTSAHRIKFLYLTYRCK